jgi:hypothetical protein
MENKDKRSLILLLALADGCLHYIKNRGIIYGGITIDHGVEQADYQAWKAKILSEVSDRNVVVRQGHRGKSVQVSLCMKRIRAWRKFTYPNGKKSIPKILKFVRHIEMALAVMLMDDGYVQQGGKTKGAKFRLFLCDQTDNDLQLIIKWFEEHFKVTPGINYQCNNKTNMTYPYLKFNADDSLKIWAIIRDFVLTFRSMKKKFVRIENSYQFDILQRTTEQMKALKI